MGRKKILEQKYFNTNKVTHPASIHPHPFGQRWGGDKAYVSLLLSPPKKITSILWEYFMPS